MKYNFKDLTAKDQDALAEILNTQLEDLTPEQISHLKARRMYLKPHQLEDYASVLEDTPVEKPLHRLTSEEALALAEEMGIDTTGLKHKDILAAIKAAQ